jgi:hypothetical protein
MGHLAETINYKLMIWCTYLHEGYVRHLESLCTEDATVETDAE